MVAVVAAAGVTWSDAAEAAPSRVPAPPDDPAPAGATAPLAAPDEESAAALAYRKGKRVLVQGLTSETSRTWARPDGTFEAELHGAPARVETSDGGWVDVDLALERKSDGSIAPKAHPRGLRLSGARSAGSTELVALGSGSEQSLLGWRGALPEPLLDGSKATYPEVKPGIDLVVEVGRTGYQYYLVVKTPQAAAELGEVVMPWQVGDETRSRGTGDQDQGGDQPDGPVISEAYMWDARVSLQTGDPSHVTEIPVRVEEAADGGTDLVLIPDPDYLADPQVEYPVVVDPSINLRPAFDAYVQNTITIDDKSREPDLRLGRVVDAAQGCSSACIARSFLSFHNLSAYQGAQVVTAELSLWNSHSWSCRAASWESWRVGYVSSSARWGNQPTWHERDGTSTGTKGYGSGCAAGWVSVSVAKTFQDTFSSSASSTANVGLRATSETGNEGWKKFHSSDASSHVPFVVVVYNRPPNVPDNLKVDSCYTACNSPAVVRTGNPQIQARVSDPDGGTLRAEYEVYNNARNTVVARSGTAVTGVSSGTARWWRIVPLSGSALPDATYHFRVRACDSHICSGYSGWFTFIVDTADLTLPQVTSDLYQPKSTGTWNGGPGVASAFTITPNGASNVTEYIYSLNGGNHVTVPAGIAQAERLTANQQSVTAGLDGFVAGPNANLFHSSMGHTAAGSLRINPNSTASTSNGPHGDTFAAIGGDSGGLRLGMQPGRKYAITGYIWVPQTTGLSTPGSIGEPRGLRIVGFYRSGGDYTTVTSLRATSVEHWQRLSVVMTVPANATEAFIRLYNGNVPGSGKHVYYDDLTVREIVGDNAVEQIIPVRDGLNVLNVQSRNAAGTTSDPTVYQFLVRPSVGSWHWALDESSGTVAASVPGDRPATFSNTGQSWVSPGRVGEGAISLAGTGELKTNQPVLDTTAPSGFTVAAWVRLTDHQSWRTAVSQDGANTSMFRLGFRNDLDHDRDGEPDPAWCFTIKTADDSDASSASACATDWAGTDDWVSLVGVYDRINNKIKLYVNGTPIVGGAYAETPATLAWSATGPFVIGRAWHHSLPADGWRGEIDHVYAVRSVWSDNRVLQHYFD
jgi:hypothetical protein